jgi:protein involved in polysaccharide export with SLBB domain
MNNGDKGADTTGFHWLADWPSDQRSAQGTSQGTAQSSAEFPLMGLLKRPFHSGLGVSCLRKTWFLPVALAAVTLLFEAGCRPGFAKEPVGNGSTPQPAQAGAAQRGAKPDGFGGKAGQVSIHRVPSQEDALSREGRIESGDLLEVRVFQEPDFDTRSRVSPAGSVEVPFAGTVSVLGATADEAARRIEGRLAEGFLVQPRVSVVVQEKAHRYFTILGQVQRPGTYRFPQETLRAGGARLDLMQALGLAGGFTRLAAPSRVTVRSGAPQESKRGGLASDSPGVRRVDARLWMERSGTPPLWIRPGDVITVGERIF